MLASAGRADKKMEEVAWHGAAVTVAHRRRSGINFG